jgi:hypothetical protein
MRTPQVMLVLLLTIAGLAVVLNRPAAAQPATPSALLRSLGEAINARDVDAAVALFTDDGSVEAVTQGGEAFAGRDRVRVWAQRLVDSNALVEFGPAFDERDSRVIWPTRLFTDPWRNLGITPVGVIVTVESEGGRIRTFSSVIPTEQQTRIAEAQARADLVMRFVAAFNTGDLDGLLALTGERVTTAGPFAGGTNSRSALVEQVAALTAGGARLTQSGSVQVTGDRVSGLFGWTVGGGSAAVVADFYLVDGRINRIVSRLTPAGGG